MADLMFEQLTSEDIVGMPLDRLGLIVLENAERSRAWNWRNWMLETRERKLSTGAQSALAEAWSWLLRHGFISTKPGSYDFHDVHITRAGGMALARGLGFVKAIIRIDIELADVLEQKVRPVFLLGDFELAALAAMREVEIAVRYKSGLGAEILGVDLMHQAFKESGPLYRDALHKAESVAQMNLFAGAIGMFKNPPSHRRVNYEDPTQASEVVLLADLLLRVLESIEVAPTPVS